MQPAKREEKDARPVWWPQTEGEFWMLIGGIGALIRYQQGKVLLDVEIQLLNSLSDDIKCKVTRVGNKVIVDWMVLSYQKRAESWVRNNFMVNHPIPSYPTNSDKNMSWESWDDRHRMVFTRSLPANLRCFIGVHAA